MKKQSNILPITTVIPIYGVALLHFLECLRSISKQTKKPSNIVFIIDGDINYKIILKLVSQFKDNEPNINIKYIRHETNEGISKSRNEGISYAQTEWISFLDADDYIQPTYFEDLYNETKDVSIVACSCYAIYGKQIYRNHLFKGDRLFKTREDLEFLEKALIKQDYQRDGTSINTAFGVPWGKLYRRSVIQNIMFDPDLCRMEDNIWNHLIILNNPDLILKYIDKPLYNYRLDHITWYNQAYDEDIQNWLSVVFKRAELVQSHIGTNDDIENFFYDEIINILVLILKKYFFHKENNHRKESFKELEEVLNIELIQKALKRICQKDKSITKNVMLKLLFRKRLYSAYLVNRLRGR